MNDAGNKHDAINQSMPMPAARRVMILFACYDAKYEPKILPISPDEINAHDETMAW